MVNLKFNKPPNAKKRLIKMYNDFDLTFHWPNLFKMLN